MPKLSIITITKNNPEGTLKTLSSIPDDHSNYLQYIIVDGDPENKNFYLGENFKKIDILLVGQDIGISDAFNKGIREAQGDYILLLNSGDELVSHAALLNAISCLGDGSDIICFGVISESSGVIIPNSSVKESAPHQGMCVGRKVYESIGGYITPLRLRMDYEFIMRAVTKGVEFKYSKIILSKYELGGVSTLVANRKTFYQEAISTDILYKGIPKFNNLLRYSYWSLWVLCRRISSIGLPFTTKSFPANIS